jgi:hypothetical protein
MEGMPQGSEHGIATALAPAQQLLWWQQLLVSDQLLLQKLLVVCEQRCAPLVAAATKPAGIL